MSPKDLRSDYPVVQEQVFLDHAATSSVARSTIERVKAVAEQMQSPLSAHFYQWLGIVEETRRLVAELINARPTELAFCNNTSMALSLIAGAIDFKPGEKVLMPRDEFPSNIYVWQNLKYRGVESQFIDVDRNVPLTHTLAQMDLTSVRLISISATSYRTGRCYELAEFTEFCRQRGILSCIDAIQQIGAAPFDVKQINPDFVASAAQKWLLGPVGCGFFYAKPELLNTLNVPVAGWTSVKYAEDFSLKELDFSSDMTRFEPGLPNILSIAGLNESLRNLAAIGWSEVFQTIQANTQYLVNALETLGIQTLADPKHLAGIVSFNIPTRLDVAELEKKLAKQKIKVTQREGYIRVSPHFYSSEQELDAFLKVIDHAHTKVPKASPKHQLPAPNLGGNKRILLTGATGLLGKAMAHRLLDAGYDLTLMGRNPALLDALVLSLGEASKSKLETRVVNLESKSELERFAQEAKSSEQRYFALVNAAGLSESDAFANLDFSKFESMIAVDYLAPVFLAKLFLEHLRAPNALGILNIVSASGRCGYPLLTGYGAANAALWTFGEALDREIRQQGLQVTTYVAPAMHSRMQKRLGRVALRYFRLSGVFDYDLPARVSKEALEVFFGKQSVVVAKANRFNLVVNALWPDAISKRIARVWRR